MAVNEERSLCDRKDICVVCGVISSSALASFSLVVLFRSRFREQPFVQVAAVNSATLDVNLKRRITDLWPKMAHCCDFLRRYVLTERMLLDHGLSLRIGLAIS